MNALQFIYYELKKEQNKPLYGLMVNSGVIAKLESRLESLRQQAAADRQFESDVMSVFNARYPEKPDNSILAPMNPDEYIWRGYLVDEWNRSRRLL